MRRIHVDVLGRVQGVGFRWFVRERAKAHGVAGWVKNLPDGSVELAAEGDDAAIAALLAEVREGPPGARVSELRDLGEISDERLPRPFTIHR